MSERVWHKGPPPHVGWWNASVLRDESAWRWWDGQEWSFACFEYEDGSDGELPDFNADTQVEWTGYWPENARVPRLDPTGGHWTFNVDGKRPEYTGTIDVAFRDGVVVHRSKGREIWDWTVDGSSGDLLAWRPAA